MTYLCYCAGSILVTHDDHLPSGSRPPMPLQPWQVVTTIQDFRGNDCQVVRLSAPATDIQGYTMMELRHTFGRLSPQEYRLAGKGAELIYWDASTRYCGLCGSPTRWQTSISKQCTQCGKEMWPSPSVAIIVRVTRGQEILLVRARNFRGSHYGLVAGFVETGETLEESVHRELWEETRICIRHLRYFGSQPWPFPFGMMVGFTAEYESGTLQLQQSELSHGGWFTADHLPPIPDKASIARRLIDDWTDSLKSPHSHP